jgi:repressor LexA
MGIISRERKIAILDYIATFSDKNGYTPTVREICKGVGLKSPASVNHYLKELESAGYIRRSPEKNRTIEIVGEKRGELIEYDTSQIPLLKHISMGISLYGRDNIRSFFSIPSDYAPSDGGMFAVIAPDDSMSGAGILRGDTVFAYSCDSIEEGDRVVCLKGDVMCLREIHLENGKVRLQSLNDDYEPEIVTQCHVVGRIF